MKLYCNNVPAQIFCLSNEPLCVQLAVQDLASDLTKISGNHPVIHNNLPTAESGIVIGTLNNETFCTYLQQNSVSTDSIQGKWENYMLLTKGDVLFIVGSDERGTMWGIYELCSKYLGVDPLYLWTDHEPAAVESLCLPEINFVDGPKTYRFRGWFINDEDLIEGQCKQGAPTNEYHFHNDYIPTLKMIVETCLRMKQNLLIPCSHLDILNPAEEALVKLITERGMFVSMHHQEPVGVHQYTMDRIWKERGVELVNFIDDPDKYQETWREYIHRWAKYDNVIWQLGLRGRGDRPVWYNNPRAPETTEARGKLIGDAMQMQLDIIREEYRDKEILSSSTLWMEGMPLYKEGALKFPEDTIIVMSDFGPNQMWGEGFYDTPRYEDSNYGVYYHLAFWGCGPHLVQGNKPEKVLFNFKNAVAKGDSYYTVTNVSNVREFVYGIKYVAQITWDIENNDIAAYRKQWCRDEFETEDTKLLEEVYEDYYNSFYEMENELIPGQMLLMDGMSKRVALKLMQIIKGSELQQEDIQNKRLYNFNSTDEFIAFYTNATESSFGRFDALMKKAEAAAELVKDSRKSFYATNMLLHISTINGLYHWVNSLAKAATNRRTGGSQEEFVALINQASQALQQAVDARPVASQGKWAHWYDGDTLMALPNVIKMTKALLSDGDTLSDIDIIHSKF